MKTCTKCGIEKDESEFGKAKKGLNGLNSSCKKCSLLRAVKWQKENHEKVKETNAKWRKENPSKLKNSIDNWRKENPEKVKLIRAKWQKENKGKVLKYDIKFKLKKQIGETPPPELVEVKLLINKTKRLCKTLKS